MRTIYSLPKKKIMGVGKVNLFPRETNENGKQIKNQIEELE
jgi:hypothetical protein